MDKKELEAKDESRSVEEIEAIEMGLLEIGIRTTDFFVAQISNVLDDITDPVRVMIEFHPKAHLSDCFGPSATYVIRGKGRWVSDHIDNVVRDPEWESDDE